MTLSHFPEGPSKWSDLPDYSESAVDPISGLMQCDPETRLSLNEDEQHLE